MCLAALFYVVPLLVFHLDCNVLNSQNSYFGHLEEKLFTAIQKGGAYKLLQMLSGFYVVGFGLLFPISFLDCCFALQSSVYHLEGSIFK